MTITRIGDIVKIRLSSSDSNVYIIGDTAFDTGTGLNFVRLKMFLGMMKKEYGDFKQVFNTHEHFDHIGGNGYFSNAKVGIHEAGAPVIENADEEMALAEYFDGKLIPKPVGVKLKDGQTIKVGDREFKIIHTPGHTPGSVCFYCEKEKLLISGDTVFSDGIGRMDIPGGDPAAMKNSLEKLSKLSVDKILPGHGPHVEKDGSKLIADFAKNQTVQEDEI